MLHPQQYVPREREMRKREGEIWFMWLSNSVVRSTSVSPLTHGQGSTYGTGGTKVARCSRRTDDYREKYVRRERDGLGRGGRLLVVSEGV